MTTVRVVGPVPPLAGCDGVVERGFVFVGRPLLDDGLDDDDVVTADDVLDVEVRVDVSAEDEDAEVGVVPLDGAREAAELPAGDDDEVGMKLPPAVSELVGVCAEGDEVHAVSARPAATARDRCRRARLVRRMDPVLPRWSV